MTEKSTEAADQGGYEDRRWKKGTRIETCENEKSRCETAERLHRLQLKK